MKKISVRACADEWTAMVDRQSAKSDHTKRQYRQEINRWIDAGLFDPDMPVARITTDHIERFTLHRAPRTAAKYTAVIRAMLGFAVGRGYITRNPAATMPSVPSRDSRDKVWVPAHQLRELIETQQHPLRRAVVATGVLSLAREAEMAALRVGDLQLDLVDSSGYPRPVMHLLRKGGKRQELGITPSLHTELKRWLTFYSQWLADNEGRALAHNMMLFPATRRGTKSTIVHGPGGAITHHIPVFDPHRRNTRLRAYVNEALEAMGYRQTGTGCHTLRRSSAKAMYEALLSQGAEFALDYVRTMLGHASIQTTEVYLGVSRHQANLNTRLQDGDIIALPVPDAAETSPGLRIVK